MSSERRKFARIPLNLLIQVRFETFEQFIGQHAENISEGGMFLKSTDPKPKGAMIYLQFSLKDGTKLIEGLGKIVHVNPKGGPNPGMGVEFVSFDEESLELIRAIVDERYRPA